MTFGELVSFLFYLQSLSDAFSSLGWVFSALTQAVGAADKVFELLNRRPRYRAPSSLAPEGATRVTGIPGVQAKKTRGYRMSGLRPDGVAEGKITLEEVDLFYPARPNRQVLNKLSLTIDPGTVVALVGQSGGGKSSVMSLIQHLYEQSAGKVKIDGHEVHELCPQWVRTTISKPCFRTRQAIDDMISRGKNTEAGKMTVLIVAHRLSTVRNADKIFVVQQGNVVEEGKHDDLLEKDGAYAQLIRRQMEAHTKLETGKEE
eukprot:scaffold34597_cov177-Amphora_coffeaeformis.AAC.12